MYICSTGSDPSGNPSEATTAGWAMGKVIIEGVGSCLGRRLSLQFQNEHLVARDGERVVAIVPDLIAVLDAATAEPITTEGLKYGQRVAVIGISAAPIMRSPAALAVFGPQAFGLTDPFIPLEQIARQAHDEDPHAYPH